jgi:ATP-dependent helicase HrpB
MTELPVESYLPEILGAVEKSGSVVVVAEPGAGKTTRVPAALLDSGLAGDAHSSVVLLQPRRVAARSIAGFLARARGGELGGEVGYQVRFEKKVSRATRLRVVTEGVLTRQLLADPFLEGVGAVVLDEFHERSLDSDLALALLKEVRATVREDLRLVVMSATLDAEAVSRYLGDCPVVRVPGRTFPVEIEYLEGGGSGGSVSERMAWAVREALDRPGDPGDILAFLPGAEEIRRTGRLLEPEARSRGLGIYPLHG